MNRRLWSTPGNLHQVLFKAGPSWPSRIHRQFYQPCKPFLRATCAVPSHLLHVGRGPSVWTQRNFFLSAPLRSTTSPHPNQPLPPLSPPSVGNWLIFSAALVFGIIVVGGVTRLTESGLSITEWKPVTGILPPLSQDDWEIEFQKYKATPEFKLLNHQITLPEFKSIFYMEYGHRVLGRLIGVTFVLPYTYFLISRKLTPSLPVKLGSLAALIGFQGFLGWYMVKSGLEEEILTTPGAVPRVSQYRLAAHLGTALVLYAGMLGLGLSVHRDWKWGAKGLDIAVGNLSNSRLISAVRKFKFSVWSLMGLVFVTAVSGAFVAGLDAGLLYNEFPTMGGRFSPPLTELFSPAYSKSANGSDKWWRNLLENPTTTQFDHRMLAMTTYVSTTALYLSSFHRNLRGSLSPLTRRLATVAFGLVNLQVALGISTLLYLVPVPLAAAHQAGSVALLTVMIALAASMRKPGRVAVIWREARRTGITR